MNNPDLSLKAIVAFESEEDINDLLDHFKSYMDIVKDGQENYFRFCRATSKPPNHSQKVAV